MLQGNACLLHIIIKDVLTDHRRRVAVLELMFYFMAGVNRADRSNFRTDSQGREVGDDILRTIQQVEGDRVPFLYS